MIFILLKQNILMNDYSYLSNLLESCNEFMNRNYIGKSYYNFIIIIIFV